MGILPDIGPYIYSYIILTNQLYNYYLKKNNYSKLFIK